MNTIEETNLFLKDLHIPECSIEELYSIMNRNKQSINNILGLNEENEYRHVLNATMNEEEFKSIYGNVYCLIRKMCKGNDFNVCGNWIKLNGVKQKLSKYVAKEYQTMTFNSLDLRILQSELRGDISTVFDLIKPKRVVISTNMYDFFTSASNASFRSCYAIDGSHFNGNISYMTDNFTFMIYTASKNLNRKIGRTWGYLPNVVDTFLIGKIYGSMYETEMNLALEYIRNRINPKIEWNYYVTEYSNYSNARPDLEYPIPVFFDCAEIKIHTEKDKLLGEPFLEFKLIHCLECGRETNYGYYGRCSRCSENIRRCEYCEIPFHIDTSNNYSVCKSCVEKHCKPCTKCGTKEWNLYHVDGEHLCIECMEVLHKRCQYCGDWCIRNDAIHVKNHVYCSSCVSVSLQCDECGEIINLYDGTPFINADGIKCTGCYIPDARYNLEETSLGTFFDGINIEQEWETTLLGRQYTIKTKVESYFAIYINEESRPYLIHKHELASRLNYIGMNMENFRKIVEYIVLKNIFSSNSLQYCYGNEVRKLFGFSRTGQENDPQISNARPRLSRLQTEVAQPRLGEEQITRERTLVEETQSIREELYERRYNVMYSLPEPMYIPNETIEPHYTVGTNNAFQGYVINEDLLHGTWGFIGTTTN